MNKVVFRFSLDRKHHADVISILESVPKSMRTAFIVEVIRLVSGRLVEIPFLNRKSTTQEPQDSINQDRKVLNPENEKQDSQNKKPPLNLSKIFGGI